jgi:hypothetical protein
VLHALAIRHHAVHLLVRADAKSHANVVCCYLPLHVLQVNRAVDYVGGGSHSMSRT